MIQTGGEGNWYEQVDLKRFAEIHDLTNAERRALLGILTGKSVSDIASAAERSRETIRSQLKRLYAKTEVNGQADLLRRVCDPIFRKK